MAIKNIRIFLCILQTFILINTDKKAKGYPNLILPTISVRLYGR